MDWKEIGQKVADVAPLLGTALGGPAGAALGALVASTLGTGGSPAAVMKKLQEDPQALIRVQELEQQERESFRDHVAKMTQLELADVQNSRETHKDHWMPSALTVALAIMVGLMAYGLMTMIIPDGSKEVLFLIVGQVLGAFMGTVTYWVGTSRSSYNKDKLKGLL